MNEELLMKPPDQMFYQKADRSASGKHDLQQYFLY